MIVALLIVITAIVPIILGFGILVLYGRSNMTLSLFIHMLLMGLWQFDIAVLYLHHSAISSEFVLVLFKILRVGLIFCVPVLLWVSYNILHQEEVKSFNKRLHKIYSLLLNKYTIVIIFLWAIIVYIINLSSYGISGLTKVSNQLLNIELYYPISGCLGFIFKIHFALYFLTILIVFGISIKLANHLLKRFMLIFTIASFVLYIIAWGNLNPDNLLLSNIAVTLYSCVIIIAFIKLYSSVVNDFQKVMEKQTKLEHAGNIASSLIHEINNSLSIIKGSVQVLPMVVPMNDSSKEMLGYMSEASMQLENLVTSYKDFLKHNNLVLKPSMENITQIIERSYNLNRELFKNSGVSFHINRNKEFYGYVDKIYLNQVFTNLIINSIDAISDDSKKKEIVVEIISNNDTIIIDFKDSGSGIPKDKWDTLFTPFISSKSKGMGLGLALCQKVIFAHRGNIKVVNSNSQGTHFQIVLPKGKFSQI